MDSGSDAPAARGQQVIVGPRGGVAVRTWQRPTPARIEAGRLARPRHAPQFCRAIYLPAFDFPSRRGRKDAVRRTSFRISRAALWPGTPVTPPPGCVPAPQR